MASDVGEGEGDCGAVALVVGVWLLAAVPDTGTVKMEEGDGDAVDFSDAEGEGVLL